MYMGIIETTIEGNLYITLLYINKERSFIFYLDHLISNGNLM